MRRFSLLALVVGVVLVPLAVALALSDHRREVQALERQLSHDAYAQAGALDAFFLRARSSILLTASSPPFARYLTLPGSREHKRSSHGHDLRELTVNLDNLTEHFGDSINVAAYVDDHGEEIARVVRGRPVRPSRLSVGEADSLWFDMTMNLREEEVHVSSPYRSESTQDWVVAVATPVAASSTRARGLVMFEMKIDAFRAALEKPGDGHHVVAVERQTGRVMFDGRRPQRIGRPLGRPGDRRYLAVSRSIDPKGVARVKARAGERIVAFRHVHSERGNANEWVLLAVSDGRAPTFADTLRALTLSLGVGGLLLILLGGLGMRSRSRELHRAATTDLLTGLPNRRRLEADLARCTQPGAPPKVLLLADLNGFKNYNDTFGHLAGDALLKRLGEELAAAVGPYGRAYRLGGDEFCVLADADRRAEVEAMSTAALTEEGDAFSVTGDAGIVLIPAEAQDAKQALALADQRMYAVKHGGRLTADRQSKDVLLRALAERHPELVEHNDGVADFARAVAWEMGLRGEELEHVRHAAELHDVGKVAIPDAILLKPGPLDEDEWAFIRRHTIIGERIVMAAPALAPVGRLVRASHERWDGGGYPDGLAGEAIPIGARIVCVCDAFDAMCSERPYSQARDADAAMAELRRCAGTQFDPAVVDAFERVLRAQQAAAAPLAEAA